MARTWYNFKELRHRHEKVQNLRRKEEQQCLAKMTQNARNGKCHAGIVAKRISDKYLRGVPTYKKQEKQQECHNDNNIVSDVEHNDEIDRLELPVVLEQPQCRCEKRQHEHEGKEMVMVAVVIAIELNHILDHNC
jgi:hypothetical protein